MKTRTTTILGVALLAMLMLAVPATAGTFNDFLGNFFLGHDDADAQDERNIAGAAIATVDTGCDDPLTFALTPHAYAGSDITSVSAGDRICAMELGKGWFWAEWHDDPDGYWNIIGNLVNPGFEQYPWVSIDDQNAECFSTGNTYGLTMRTKRMADGCMEADCHGMEKYFSPDYNFQVGNGGSLISCNPYAGDTPCTASRPLLCVQKDITSCSDAVTQATCEREGCVWDGRACFDEPQTQELCTVADGLLAMGEAPPGPFVLSDHFGDPVTLTFPSEGSSSNAKLGVTVQDKPYTLQLLGANTGDPNNPSIILRVSGEEGYATRSLQRGDNLLMVGLRVYVQSVVVTGNTAVTATVRTGPGDYHVNLYPLYECDGKTVVRNSCNGYLYEFDSTPVKTCDSGCYEGACTAPQEIQYESYCRVIDGHLEQGEVPAGTSLSGYHPFTMVQATLNDPLDLDGYTLELLGDDSSGDKAILRVSKGGSMMTETLDEGDQITMLGLEIYLKEVLSVRSGGKIVETVADIYYSTNEHDLDFELTRDWACEGGEIGGQYLELDCAGDAVSVVKSENCDFLCEYGGCIEPDRYCTVMQNHVERGVFRPYVQRNPLTAFRSMNIDMGETFTVEAQGDEYDVTLLGGNTLAQTIILRVDGPQAAVTRTLRTGDTRLIDGLLVYIDDVLFRNVGENTVSAVVFYTPDESELRKQYMDKYDEPLFDMQPLRGCEGGNVVSHGCDGDAISTEVIQTCTNGCLDGACLRQSNASICYDSDGPQGYYDEGYRIHYNYSHSGAGVKEEDYCILDPASNPSGGVIANMANKVDECGPGERCYAIDYHCADDLSDSFSAKLCAFGCEDGACIPAPANRTCAGYGDMDSCLNDSACYWDQEDDVCYLPVAGEQQCHDYDNGINGEVKAFTYGKRLQYADEHDRRIRTGGVDVCLNGYSLQEHYCQGDYIQTTVITCDNGCSDGACIAQESRCSDSDNGDIYRKGFVNNGGESFEDGKFYVDDSHGDNDMMSVMLEVYPDQSALFTIMGDAQTVREGETLDIGSFRLHITDVVYDAKDYGGGSYVAFEIMGIYDFCDNEGHLQEVICDGSGYNLKEVECDGSCYDGACVSGGSDGSGSNSTPGEYVPNCQDGCALRGSCVPFGMRADGQYCGLNSEMNDFKAEDAYCENNFECSTNLCVNSGCVSQGFFDRLWRFLSRWF